jgi:CarD family transcriptional regulator
MLKVGKYVSYPAYGVAVVKRIDKKEVGGKSKEFAVIQTIQNQMTLLIPLDQADQLGVRPLVTGDKAKEILAWINNPEVDLKVDQTTWNRRYREYMEKLKTGDIDQVAFVYKSLTLLRESKDLSFGERKMKDQAKYLLATECAVALGMSADDADSLVSL